MTVAEKYEDKLLFALPQRKETSSKAAIKQKRRASKLFKMASSATHKKHWMTEEPVVSSCTTVAGRRPATIVYMLRTDSWVIS